MPTQPRKKNVLMQKILLDIYPVGNNLGGCGGEATSQTTVSNVRCLQGEILFFSMYGTGGVFQYIMVLFQQCTKTQRELRSNGTRQLLSLSLCVAGCVLVSYGIHVPNTRCLSRLPPQYNHSGVVLCCSHSSTCGVLMYVRSTLNRFKFPHISTSEDKLRGHQITCVTVVDTDVRALQKQLRQRTTTQLNLALSPVARGSPHRFGTWWEIVVQTLSRIGRNSRYIICRCFFYVFRLVQYLSSLLKVALLGGNVRGRLRQSRPLQNRVARGLTCAIFSSQTVFSWMLSPQKCWFGGFLLCDFDTAVLVLQ